MAEMEWIDAADLSRQDLLDLSGWKIDEYAKSETLKRRTKPEKAFFNAARVAMLDFRIYLEEGAPADDLTAAREWATPK